MSYNLNVAEGEIDSFIEQHKKILLFLHDTPPIPGMVRAKQNEGIDPLDNTTYEQWLKRLETIFIAKLQNQGSIDQLRIVSVEGLEILRVDRLSGRIIARKPFELQDKSASDYVATARDLQRDQFYISSINLNREFGEIEYPYRPTQRYIISIFKPDGTQFGFFIMNVNPKVVLWELQQSLQEDVDIILLNETGQFVWHHDKNLRYAVDLHPKLSWPLELNDFNTAIQREVIWGEQEFITEQRPVESAISARSKGLYLVAALPEKVRQKMISDMRWST